MRNHFMLSETNAEQIGKNIRTDANNQQINDKTHPVKQ